MWLRLFDESHPSVKLCACSGRMHLAITFDDIFTRDMPQCLPKSLDIVAKKDDLSCLQLSTTTSV